jgi:putative hemolysin
VTDRALDPSGSAILTRAARERHIIDTLIAERAPSFVSSPLWPVLRPALNTLLNRNKAVRMADHIAPLDGLAAMQAVSDLLRVDVVATGLERLPREGKVVIVSNHPTGIADGIAAWDALRPIRPDLAFYANSDAHRVSAGFIDVLVPVEWEDTKRTRDKTRTTLRLTQELFARNGALFIFPAGRLARLRNGVLRDPDWMTSAVSIARKNNAPILPVNMTGPWSFWFHAFDKVSKELRDITLFHELLNKRGKRFTLSAGPLIPPDALDGDPGDVTQSLKDHIELVMPGNADAVWGGVEG